MLDELGNHVADVFMEEPQYAHAKGDKQERLGDFEERNENQPSIVVFLPDRRLRWGIGHDLPVERVLNRLLVPTLNDTRRFCSETVPAAAKEEPGRKAGEVRNLAFAASITFSD
jgi:hypothetical protein